MQAVSYIAEAAMLPTCQNCTHCHTANSNLPKLHRLQYYKLQKQASQPGGPQGGRRIYLHTSSYLFHLFGIPLHTSSYLLPGSASLCGAGGCRLSDIFTSNRYYDNKRGIPPRNKVLVSGIFCSNRYSGIFCSNRYTSFGIHPKN